jgi:hypothetical protein
MTISATLGRFARQVNQNQPPSSLARLKPRLDLPRKRANPMLPRLFKVQADL